MGLFLMNKYLKIFCFNFYTVSIDRYNLPKNKLFGVCSNLRVRKDSKTKILDKP